MADLDKGFAGTDNSKPGVLMTDLDKGFATIMERFKWLTPILGISAIVALGAAFLGWCPDPPPPRLTGWAAWGLSVGGARIAPTATAALFRYLRT